MTDDGELNDAVGLAAKTAHRRGVVECVAGDGQTVDAPVADVLVRTFHTVDDTLPRPSIDGINDNPDTDNWNEPIACMTEMVPQLGKADVEGEQHHHHGYYAK